MKKRGIILIIFIFVVVIILSYVTFFYHPRCQDLECWNYKLENCKKATYINTPQDVDWLYTIEGKSEESCIVKAEIIDIKRGLKKAEVLEGKEMTCLLPLGAVLSPESNTNNCNGPLKEAMQQLIIEKLYQHILDNLGQISGELTGIEGVSGNVETPQATTGNSTNSS